MLLTLTLLACSAPDTTPAHSDGDTDPVPHTASTTGDTAPATEPECVDHADCDDGLACSDDRCDVDRCIHVPTGDCAWPASAPEDSILLAAGAPELQVSQSGADWDPVHRRLWLVQNSGPAAVWRLIETGPGTFAVDTVPSGGPAMWSGGFDDAEGITLVDPSEPDTVFLVIEGDEVIREYDLSGREADLVQEYDTSQWLPLLDRSGAEGITFVPDTALAEWGFTDANGDLAQSTLGMGGLLFVGHQNGGGVYAFDANRATGAVRFVGGYATARNDTSGLDFDPSTGRLYLWHGAGSRDLEVARLSSTPGATTGQPRRLVTEYVFDYPAPGNTEGVAVQTLEDCGSGGRGLFVIADDFGAGSIQLYPDWPCP